MRIEKNFVTFFSPGTFVHEETTKEIDNWNVDEARDMARGIVERHGATPFAFQFSTRRREEDDLDSKVVSHSGTVLPRWGRAYARRYQVQERSKRQDSDLEHGVQRI